MIERLPIISTNKDSFLIREQRPINMTHNSISRH
jgi:hypothetical protein